MNNHILSTQLEKKNINTSEATSALSLVFYLPLSKIVLNFVFMTPLQFTIVLPHVCKSCGLYYYISNINGGKKGKGQAKEQE